MKHATIPCKLLAAGLLMLVGLAACDNDAKPPVQESKKDRSHLVEVAVAHQAELAHEAVRTGTLEANLEIKIYNQEDGRVTQLPVYEGDRVQRGQVLVRLDDALLKAQLDKAVATRQQAQQDVDRLQRLIQKRLVSEDELARATTALKVAQAEEELLRTRLDYTTIKAPISGVVTNRLVETGDIAPKFTHLLTLIDPGSLITQVEVSELLLPLFAPGDPVRVRIDALGEKEHPGRIRRIHPTVDPRTRKGIIEVELSPVPDGARAGQLCRVRLTARARERLVIPFAAVRRGQDSEYVYIVDDQGKAQRRAIRTGMRQELQVEVLEGLAAGDAVITKGLLGLRDGMAVKKVTRHDNAAEGASAG